MTDPVISEAFDMEALGITDYDVYQRQPQDILDARRAIRSERARLRKIELDHARARAGLR